MARPLRIDLAGGWYHVTSRGNERRSIFRDDRDRLHLRELLGDMHERFGVRLHAYVWMANHYHLLVETPRANLSAAMQWLNGSYSVWFNRRHRRVGHLFQGRFQAIVVDRDQWGLSLSRYIHLNPVRMRRYGLGKQAQRVQRAGLGEKADAKQVEERIGALRGYRWSSYRAYTGLEASPPWLETETVLGLGGAGSRGQRGRGYQRYVEEAVRAGLEESPWEELEAGVVLGAAEFVARIRRGLRGDAKEQPGLRRLQGVPSWGQVVAMVEQMKGEKWASFRDRHRDWGRDLALYLGRKRCGLKLGELGAAVGGVDDASVGMAVKRFGERAAKEKELRQWLEKADKMLNVGM